MLIKWSFLLLEPRGNVKEIKNFVLYPYLISILWLQFQLEIYESFSMINFILGNTFLKFVEVDSTFMICLFLLQKLL